MTGYADSMVRFADDHTTKNGNSSVCSKKTALGYPGNFSLQNSDVKPKSWTLLEVHIKTDELFLLHR